MAVGLFLLTGCSVSRLKGSADQEVYRILDEKTDGVTGEKVPWGIEPEEVKDSTSSGPLFLMLKDALVVAAQNNYDYQTRKENVYRKALALSSRRQDFRLRYTLGGDIDWEKNGTESVGGNLDFGLTKWLAQGAQITFDITESFLKYLAGDRDKAFQSILSLNILQPLFRGAGRKIAQESLLQAERNVVYEIRSFLRYQRSFSVDVAEKFFAILKSKNSLENYWNNYVYLKETRKRIEMLSEAGRIPPLQADQAKQNEYKAYQNWIENANAYKTLLDEFKIFLGVALSTDVSVNEQGLEKFLREGIPEIKVSPEQFIDAALENRLDLITVSDETDDAKRKVDVALDKLRVKADLSVGVDISTPEKSYPTFDLGGPDYEAGLDLDFPVNKISERNAYRESLINLRKAERDLVKKKDEIRLDIFNSCRDLQEAYETYVIQNKSLELAKNRVESTDLLLQAGRATTRDLLEAQESYLSAKNSLASAIVNYWISYLEFLQDSELLELDDKGVWKGDLYEKISGETHQE